LFLKNRQKMEIRNSQDLSQSLICNGVDGQYTLPQPNVYYQYGNGNVDTAILEIIEVATNQSILFFKQVLSICIVGQSDCNQITDGRGANVARPYVRLSGLIASCDNLLPQWKTIGLYPAEGQTLVELQLQILNISGRN
jgi:hypothetical protein